MTCQKCAVDTQHQLFLITGVTAVTIKPDFEKIKSLRISHPDQWMTIGQAIKFVKKMA